MKFAKRSAIALFVLLLSIGLGTHDAEAKRLGGGGSTGMSRSGSVMNKQAVPPKPATPAPSAAPATPAAPAAAPAPARSPWMGMLGGLALGAGIGALLGHFGLGGLGGGFGSILMLILIAGAAFFLIRMFMRRNEPSAQPLQYAGAGYNVPAEPAAAALPVGGAPAAPVSGSVPAGFDVEGFVRQAKLNFVRLQASNDAGNMEDIRAFTSPEMYAEIQLEYQERGKAAQQTDVVQLNAELLDVTSEGSKQVASVRFSGSIRESANAAPEAFDEVWHLTRPADASTGWVIAGIQQYA